MDGCKYRGKWGQFRGKIGVNLGWNIAILRGISTWLSVYFLYLIGRRLGVF